MSAICHECGMPLIWAVTDGGKRVPLDAKPEKRFIITGHAGGDNLGCMVDTYITHFATCPAKEERL